jgi:hypothetical protein
MLNGSSRRSITPQGRQRPTGVMALPPVRQKMLQCLDSIRELGIWY